LKLKKAGAKDFVIGRSALSRDEEDDEEVLPGAGMDGKQGIKAEVEGDGLEDTDTEGPSDAPSASSSVAASTFSIIPSPTTENDPPAFPIESAAPTPAEDEGKQDTPGDEYKVTTIDIDGPVRVLRPTSGFSGFTLWTTDTALPGYIDPNVESTTVPIEASAIAEESKSSVIGESDNTGDETGPKVRPSWWAAGGAGEGGDGIVRALGEFVGLAEMVSVITRSTLRV
jgi:hypothetical protein